MNIPIYKAKVLQEKGKTDQCLLYAHFPCPTRGSDENDSLVLHFTCYEGTGYFYILHHFSMEAECIKIGE